LYKIYVIKYRFNRFINLFYTIPKLLLWGLLLESFAAMNPTESYISWTTCSSDEIVGTKERQGEGDHKEDIGDWGGGGRNRNLLHMSSVPSVDIHRPTHINSLSS
jgi:hypothetical protein